jgi:CheY-like chemotaxis protein
MQIALEQAGHSVRRFPDGPSALAGVADLKPDAVLLDIGLPGMDGYELSVELKKQINMRDALFIALSGFKPRDQTGQEGADFDYHFTKPVDVHALVALLDTSLADASRKHREPKKTRRLRVLLVEDHPDLAAATASLLRGEDFEVQTALTGREALEAAPNFRPQLIFCDLNLPDMGGLEVIRALRSIPSTQQTHAVILTALSEMEIRVLNSEAGELGVDAFMSKPIKVDAVRTMVSKLKP